MERAKEQKGLTGTAVCQLYGVGEIRGCVLVLLAVLVAVVADQLGIDVDVRDVVDDTTNLEFAVLQQVS